MQKTNLHTFNNNWYRPGNRVAILLWFLLSHVFINNYLPIPVAVKRFILRVFGAKIGEGVMLKPAINIKYPWRLSIGSYAWIGEGVWIDNLAYVSIGAHACVSQGAMLLTGNHDYTKTTFDLRIGEITLEEGVWIGAKAVVCPGVLCASHAVLAVGSVATKALTPYTIYQGNPAVAVKERTLA